MQRRAAGRGLGAVLFTDIVGSTTIAAEMGNTRWGELVERHHRILRRLIGRFDGREVDTAGDGFFATFERPADAIRCAVAAVDEVHQLGIEIRAGVGFGELETVGHKAGGLVVNTTARVMAVAGPGEVLVPASVREIVPGSGITFADHGVHQLKGLEGEFHLFSVTGVDGREVPPPLEAAEAAERRRDIFPGATRRRGALIAGLAGGLLALVVAGIIVVTAGDAQPERPGPAGPLRNAVAAVDPESGRITSSVPLGGVLPDQGSIQFVTHPLAVGQGGVWVLKPPTMLHVDPLREEIRNDRIEVGFGLSMTVTTGFDAVWALSAATLYRVNPATDELSIFLELPPEAGLINYSLALSDVIWVGVSDGTLVRLEPSSGARDQVQLDASIDAITATRDDVWIVDVLAGGLIRVDPDTMAAADDPIAVEGNIDQVTARGDAVWVLDSRLGVVTKIDASTGTVSGSARVGNQATDMAVGADAVWVGDHDGTLFRVNPSTLQVEPFEIGAEVIGVAVDEGADRVWVYVGKPLDT